jgi:transcriptional regulator with XRE-family HTH domain
MRDNLGGISPIQWSSLVQETRRRRKAEKLTQRDHAALAGVSVPTLAAFDRGDLTLTLGKAFDILRVVGLVDEPSLETAQDIFVRDAFSKKMAAIARTDCPYGWCRIDCWFEGTEKNIDEKQLDQLVQQMVDLSSGAYLHFKPDGRMFLLRGYQEDAQKTFPPGKIFDPTAPILLLGNALLLTEKLAIMAGQSPENPITVHFRVLYTGLAGRVLRHWLNPLSSLVIGNHIATGDEVLVEATIPAANISAHLAEHLFPLVTAIYKRFGLTDVPLAFFNAEVARLLS